MMPQHRGLAATVHVHVNVHPTEGRWEAALGKLGFSFWELSVSSRKEHMVAEVIEVEMLYGSMVEPTYTPHGQIRTPIAAHCWTDGRRRVA